MESAFRFGFTSLVSGLSSAIDLDDGRLARCGVLRAARGSVYVAKRFGKAVKVCDTLFARRELARDALNIRRSWVRSAHSWASPKLLDLGIIDARRPQVVVASDASAGFGRETADADGRAGPGADVAIG